jgi:hypothetical protein
VCTDVASSLRVLRRRADPSSPYEVVAPVITTPSLSNGFLQDYYEMQTEPGDVFRFQWNSACAIMSLVPQPLDTALLGVPGSASPPISVYVNVVSSD